MGAEHGEDRRTGARARRVLGLEPREAGGPIYGGAIRTANRS
jgi:hypothetical protein